MHGSDNCFRKGGVGIGAMMMLNNVFHMKEKEIRNDPDKFLNVSCRKHAARYQHPSPNSPPPVC